MGVTLDEAANLWLRAVLQEELCDGPSAANALSHWGVECLCSEASLGWHSRASTTQTNPLTLQETNREKEGGWTRVPWQRDERENSSQDSRPQSRASLTYQQINHLLRIPYVLASVLRCCMDSCINQLDQPQTVSITAFIAWCRSLRSLMYSGA